MKKRQWAIVAGIAIIVGALLLKKMLSSSGQSELPQKKASVKGVEVDRVKNENIPVTIYLDGKLNAVNSIDLFAEVNGILQGGKQAFDEGIAYNKGDVILQLDNSEAKAAYLASVNEYINIITQALPDIQIDFPEEYPKWKKYLEELTSRTTIPAPPEASNPQLKLFLTGRGIYSTYQNLSSSRVRLSKFSITAPFKGVVTEALVREGALVRAGQKIGRYLQPGLYELEATISLKELQLLDKGDSVKLSSADIKGEWTGTVYRTNAAVDPATQRVKVFIRVNAPELADGVFMNGKASGKIIGDAYRLPRKLLYNDRFTYIVQDSVLAPVELEILKRNPGDVIVKGLPDGANLPLQPIPGAFKGMKVKIVSSSNKEA